jgi:hypothetical protein
VRTSERGATTAFVAISLLVLFGFMALAMNVGHGRVVRGQLQNAVDAAALAAAKELDGTTTPLTNGSPQAWAVDIASRHETDKAQSVDVSPVNDFEFGWWDPYGTDAAASFYPLNSARFTTKFPDATTPADRARIVNAVHVTALRTQARGNAVGAWFGSLVGKETMDIGADAVAINGGPCGVCPNVPLAFFGCSLYYDDTLQCWKSERFHYEMAPDPSDSIGYTSLSPDLSANTNVYKDILACGGQGACCAQYTAQTNDLISVSNGNQLTPLCSGFNQYCNADANGVCHDQPVIRVPVVAGDCPAKFNQAHAVVGIATVRMMKLVCKGSQKYMEFEFRCDEVDSGSDRYGCGFWGTGPTEPRLVR